MKDRYNSKYILFCKIDLIPSKIKKSRSGIVCTHQCTFLSMNCIPNFIAITIPEETRRVGISSWYRSEKKRNFWRSSPRHHWGAYSFQTPQLHFSSTSLRLTDSVVGYHRLNTIPLLAPGLLTYFMPLISFYTPWKHQKTRVFLMFSEGIESNQWHEMC